MLFHPKADEINLLTLCKDKTKQFYFPRVDGEQLLCCPYSMKENLLKQNKWSVFEPQTENVDKNMMDVIFVPALATDENFNRLGYGKGFYDRFLQNCSAIKAVPTYDEVFFKKVPTTQQDIPADFLIFPNKILTV